LKNANRTSREDFESSGDNLLFSISKKNKFKNNSIFKNASIYIGNLSTENYNYKIADIDANLRYKYLLHKNQFNKIHFYNNFYANGQYREYANKLLDISANDFKFKFGANIGIYFKFLNCYKMKLQYSIKHRAPNSFSFKMDFDF
jgi:hypothetical protein